MTLRNFMHAVKHTHAKTQQMVSPRQAIRNVSYTLASHYNPIASYKFQPYANIIS